MVRFKVVRASRLLLVAVVVLLAAALALIGARLLRQEPEPAVSGTANLVDAGSGDEAKTTLVFASSGVAEKPPLDPGSTGIEVEILSRESTSPEPKKVLIYHTHTHEAYDQAPGETYAALEAWRTTDADHSVVRVGEELAGQLRSRGFDVTHDTTDPEGNSLSTAYTRSIVTLEGYDKRFDLYIDLHRDAWTEGEEVIVAGENGEALAPLMLLIGNGNGFDEKPYYAENFAFAKALEERINAISPGLCKPTLVKDGRYNQHIGVFAILVEVGHNKNTLSQALSAVPPLAEGIWDLMVKSPDAELEAMQEAFVSGR